VNNLWPKVAQDYFDLAQVLEIRPGGWSAQHVQHMNFYPSGAHAFQIRRETLVPQGRYHHPHLVAQVTLTEGHVDQVPPRATNRALHQM
jgi:hypothetical protein